MHEVNVWYGRYQIVTNYQIGLPEYFVKFCLDLINNILVYEHQPERFNVGYLLLHNKTYVLWDDTDKLNDYLRSIGHRHLPNLQAGNEYRYDADTFVICLLNKEEGE